MRCCVYYPFLCPPLSCNHGPCPSFQNASGSFVLCFAHLQGGGRGCCRDSVGFWLLLFGGLLFCVDNKMRDANSQRSFSSLSSSFIVAISLLLLSELARPPPGWPATPPLPALSFPLDPPSAYRLSLDFLLGVFLLKLEGTHSSWERQHGKRLSASTWEPGCLGLNITAANCVTSGCSLNLSEPQFLHLEKGCYGLNVCVVPALPYSQIYMLKP